MSNTQTLRVTAHRDGEARHDEGPNGYKLTVTIDGRTEEVAYVQRAWEGTWQSWYLHFAGQSEGPLSRLRDAKHIVERALTVGVAPCGCMFEDDFGRIAEGSSPCPIHPSSPDPERI